MYGLTHMVKIWSFFFWIYSRPLQSFPIIFVIKVVITSVEINTINDLIFIIEMDNNRKDYSENRLIKRINEARNYKNKYSNMMAAAHASGKSDSEISDEMKSWFAKNAARADINKDAWRSRSQMRSEQNTTEKFDKMNYKGYKFPRTVNSSERCYNKFCHMNDLNPTDFSYKDFIGLITMRDTDERVTNKYNREMNNYIDEVNPTFYDGDYNDDIYADIDEKLGINTKRMTHLNEMSDELLNKATIAAMDRGDFEKAKKFNAWKNDPKRKENLAASELIKNAPLAIALPSNKAKFMELLERAVKNHEIEEMPYPKVPYITGRAFNYAETNGWNKIGDLMNVDLEKLRRATNLKKSIQCLIDLLEGIGFHWDMVKKKWSK